MKKGVAAKRRGDFSLPLRQLLSAAVLLAALAGTASAASLLPLVAEEAATLPSGTSELVLGASYFNGLRYPNFTYPTYARHEELVSVPELAFHIGLGDWVEIQASYEFLLHIETINDGQPRDSKYGGGDARLFTKVRILREDEWWPGLGLRFGTKLPNANAQDRLGTDQIDWAADILASRDFGFLTAHLNLGIQLLGNPDANLPGNASVNGGQDDLFGYDFALVGKPLPVTFLELRPLAEIVGLTGSHNHNDRTSLRGGLQISGGGALAGYLGASAGLQTGSERFGFMTGIIWTFRPASLWEEEVAR